MTRVNQTIGLRKNMAASSLPVLATAALAIATTLGA